MLSSAASSAATSAPGAAFTAHLRKELDTIQAAGTYKRERVITSPQLASVSVQGREKTVINFCANNYLGLSDHPEIRRAALDAIGTHGVGLSSVRFICGTQDIHKKLERTVADFHKTEDAILFPSCFDANAGIFEALFGADDAILSDELNHASIIDGVRLSKARRFRYKHRDMADLEAQLKEAANARFRVIATDGVFSMDGNVAPLPQIRELADRYNAIVFVDECHATGAFGATGRGTPEYFGLEGRIDIINSTLGKAMGGATGGYTASSTEIVDILRQRGRPYLFSNSIAPSVVGASQRAYDMLSESNERVERLASNTRLFRDRISRVGFEVLGAPDHPIVPILLRDERTAGEMAARMLEEGVYVIGFSFPVVPRGLARIRTQVSAGHTEEQILYTVAAFEKVGREMGVLKK